MDKQDGLYRLEDLAALAGVSISTVSRALNDSPLVSERTKKKIRDLAFENNYDGRLRDKVFVEADQRTISVIIPPQQSRDSRMSDGFLLHLIGGIDDALREQGCDLLISHGVAENLDSALALVNSKRADGLIVLGQSTMHDQLNEIADQNIPMVVWGAQLEDQRYCSVGSDNKTGGRRATNHLIRMGRRKIAFLGDTDSPEATLRYLGYVDALNQHGFEVDPNLFRSSAFYPESAMEAVDALLDTGVSFDGIIAASDMVAIGAERALMRAGLIVPKDVAVVGYDDMPLAAFSSPALTTIRQDIAQAGRLLVNKLLRAVEGEQVRSGLLPTELIVRESCGA